jgi:pyruvate formate lyase activating enzyme
MEQAGLKSVSFTYSEPTVWQDWMLDAAFAVKARGGRCYMVTNGSFTPESRGRFWGLIDAYNIDVKGDDAFYREYCRGYLEPVLDNVAALCREPAVLVEVCTLLIEGIHTVDGIIRLGKELAAAGLKIWHLSRFHPAWKMRDHPPTSQEFLDQVLEALRDTVDIPFIYPGNSPRVTETACPACGRLLIARDTDWPGRLVVAGNRCPDCGLVFPLLT